MIKVKLSNPKWYEWIIRPKTAIRQHSFYKDHCRGRYYVPYVPLTIIIEPYIISDKKLEVVNVDTILPELQVTNISNPHD